MLNYNNLKSIIHEPKYKLSKSKNGITIINYQFVYYSDEFKNSLNVTRFKNNFFNKEKNPEEISQKQKEEIIKAMKEWEKVANIKFIENDKNVNLYIGAIYDKKDYVAVALPIEDNYSKTALMINNKYLSDYYLRFKTTIWYLLHELGHALGLKHPNENGITLAQEFDNIFNTVMFINYEALKLSAPIYPKTPMPLDIEAIQFLYGKNNLYNLGNTIYKISGEDKGLYTIWDAGGIDVIDTSAIRTDVKVNLQEGFNNESKIINELSLFIAKGSNIENAITGNGNDIIIGNDLDNEIYAGNGNDQITGNKGKNIFVFKENDFGNKVITDFKPKIDKIKIIEQNKKITKYLNYLESNEDFSLLKINDMQIVKIMGCNACLDHLDFI